MFDEEVVGEVGFVDCCRDYMLSKLIVLSVLNSIFCCSEEKFELVRYIYLRY